MRKSSVLIIYLFFIYILSFGRDVYTGAEQMDKLIPLLKGKSVGLIVNHSSLIGNTGTHLLDTLLSQGIKIKKIFAPEHGFRGTADAGEAINNSKDKATGIPIISLYGKNKKPTTSQLKDVDILLFDIQDVGARFFTYISTLHYVMDACAQNNKPLIIADRPNPCDYVDGPIRKSYLKSFVSLDPIPILHGCTVGELANMINEEGWLDKKLKVKLTVIPIKGWKHGEPYSPVIKPSPNLPNDLAIAFYPSLCPFEGTAISVGRGTDIPFQVIGSPDIKVYSFSFTPRSMKGFDTNPLYKDIKCFGNNLKNITPPKGLTLQYIISYYKEYKKNGKEKLFFTRPKWFDTLIGDSIVRRMIIDGADEKHIRSTWKEELDEYKEIRNKYLLY